MVRVNTQFPSGRLVLAVLGLSLVWWAVMVFGTLRHLQTLAGGDVPFDLRPFGYSHGEAARLLAALGAAGRDFYAHVQLRLDLVYPALYAASRMLAIWWLTRPGRIAWLVLPLSLRVGLLVAPALTMLFDYRENAGIAAMLASGQAVDPALVDATSLSTQIKSAAGTVSELTATILAIAALIGWWRQRTAA